MAHLTIRHFMEEKDNKERIKDKVFHMPSPSLPLNLPTQPGPHASKGPLFLPRAVSVEGSSAHGKNVPLCKLAAGLPLPVQSVFVCLRPVTEKPLFKVRDMDVQRLPVQADDRLLPGFHPEPPPPEALTGRGGGQIQPGDGAPFAPVEGREGSALCRQRQSQISPRKTRQAQERDPQLPSSWRGKISWEEEEGRPRGRRESSPTCHERDPKASREGSSADPPRRKRESRKEA
ncbi:hypothetical protein E2320_014405 [Naja naja]|nr:hypothetical protein E2320_014405 [Naja naja]